jgi:hypothetical protein
MEKVSPRDRARSIAVELPGEQRCCLPSAAALTLLAYALVTQGVKRWLVRHGWID